MRKVASIWCFVASCYPCIICFGLLKGNPLKEVGVVKAKRRKEVPYHGLLMFDWHWVSWTMKVIMNLLNELVNPWFEKLGFLHAKTIQNPRLKDVTTRFVVIDKSVRWYVIKVLWTQINLGEVLDMTDKNNEELGTDEGIKETTAAERTKQGKCPLTPTH